MVHVGSVSVHGLKCEDIHVRISQNQPATLWVDLGPITFFAQDLDTIQDFAYAILDGVDAHRGRERTRILKELDEDPQTPVLKKLNENMRARILKELDESLG